MYYLSQAVSLCWRSSNSFNLPKQASRFEVIKESLVPHGVVLPLISIIFEYSPKNLDLNKIGPALNRLKSVVDQLEPSAAKKQDAIAWKKDLVRVAKSGSTDEQIAAIENSESNFKKFFVDKTFIRDRVYFDNFYLISNQFDAKKPPCRCCHNRAAVPETRFYIYLDACCFEVIIPRKSNEKQDEPLCLQRKNERYKWNASNPGQGKINSLFHQLKHGQIFFVANFNFQSLPTLQDIEEDDPQPTASATTTATASQGVKKQN